MGKPTIALPTIFSRGQRFRIYGDILKTKEDGKALECTRLYFVSDRMMVAFLVRTLLDSPDNDYVFYICGVDSDLKKTDSLTLIFEPHGGLSSVKYSKFVFEGSEYISSIDIFGESCELSIAPSSDHYFSFALRLSEVS